MAELVTNVSEQLRPLLLIRGMTLTDRDELENLIREADRAVKGFNPNDTARVELYIERSRRVLQRAAYIVSKYSDEE